jgi:hypothetical protein
MALLSVTSNVHSSQVQELCDKLAAQGNIIGGTSMEGSTFFLSLDLLLLHSPLLRNLLCSLPPGAQPQLLLPDSPLDSLMALRSLLARGEARTGSAGQVAATARALGISITGLEEVAISGTPSRRDPSCPPSKLSKIMPSPPASLARETIPHPDYSELEYLQSLQEKFYSDDMHKSIDCPDNFLEEIVEAEKLKEIFYNSPAKKTPCESNKEKPTLTDKFLINANKNKQLKNGDFPMVQIWPDQEQGVKFFQLQLSDGLNLSNKVCCTTDKATTARLKHIAWCKQSAIIQIKNAYIDRGTIVIKDFTFVQVRDSQPIQTHTNIPLEKLDKEIIKNLQSQYGTEKRYIVKPLNS